jgi:hypothetical protein
LVPFAVFVDDGSRLTDLLPPGFATNGAAFLPPKGFFVALRSSFVHAANTAR